MKKTKHRGQSDAIRSIEIRMEQINSKITKFWPRNLSFSADPVIFDLKIQLVYITSKKFEY